MNTIEQHRTESGGMRGSQRPLVIGVDGCRGGWVAIVVDREHYKLEPVFVARLKDLIDAYPQATIGVDMPIGLSSSGKRQCDFDARKFLGPGRTSSVFPPPIPQVLAARTYEEASQLSKRHHPEQKSLSRQTFAILPGMLEVREVITPDLQQRVVEVHPEVSFTALAGRPMRFGKRTPEGFEERRGLLQAAFEIEIPVRSLMRSFFSQAAPDDVLDAMVAAWSARRFAEGTAERFPAVEERDELGLRMEMVY